MSWREWLTDPAATITAGLGTAIIAQFAIWRAARRSEAAKRRAEETGLSVARLGSEDEANERLFTIIKSRLDQCEKWRDESERACREQDRRINRLEGSQIRMRAAIAILRAAIAGSGLKEPPLPPLDDEPGMAT